MAPRPSARVVVIALLLAAASNTAPAAEVTLNVEVAGERWKTVRLKNLPRGASISLQIRTSGSIRVIVVDSSELKRFPKTRALFEAIVDKRFGFSVMIPRSGDYYVVFDNRTSTQSRDVTLRVLAEPPKRNNKPAEPRQEKLDQTRGREPTAVALNRESSVVNSTFRP